MVLLAPIAHALTIFLVAAGSVLADDVPTATSVSSDGINNDNRPSVGTSVADMSGGVTATGDSDDDKTASTIIRSTDSVGTKMTTNSKSGLRSSASSPSFCEARTINSITHTLPQLCFTTTWTSSASMPTENPVGGIGTEPAVDAPTTTIAAEQPATTFMSFEDWKEMMLRRAGQDPQELRSRKPHEAAGNDKAPPDTGHAGLGEEGEISLDFGQYGNGDEQGNPSDSTGGDNGEGKVDDALVYGDGKASTRRSKDAGKTCKERFSYSSFDAGATILKANSGAKNAKAILVENKDSYMLLECATPNKYVIVELSDDILVDTIVLANFEFFSSMIRHFRVSVSDRYPVKLDKWKEVATFEARNSRDIQPFLVENPQIWAKYIKIEFLTQYGNEYYCPVSLLRVHGSRMLDSWKDHDTSRDDDLETLDESESVAVPEIPPFVGNHSDTIITPESTTPWHPPLDSDPFMAMRAICPAPLLIQSNDTQSAIADNPSKKSEPADQPGHQLTSQPNNTTPHSPEISDTRSTKTPSAQSQISASISSSSRLSHTSAPSNHDGSNRNSSSGPAANEFTSNSTVMPSRTSTPGASGGKNRSSGTSSATAASPTVQEGFFHAITKRLQQVESNLTLSLKYVEDQSRHVQEALQRAEQNQLSKVSLFLEDLNNTVLAEMRNVREQYDQIWQSTVLALESQRVQSERDIVALSSRLNLLADEVVFQKRMAIVQAVLLLSCLFLVIFSRGVPIPYVTPLLESNSGVSYLPAVPQRMHRSSPYNAGRELSPEDEGTSDLHHNLHYSPGGVSADDSIEDIVSVSGESSNLHNRGFQPDQPASSKWGRLSPPPTPGLRTATAPSAATTSARSSHDYSLLLTSGVHHIDSRKPLPSLPEHPGTPQGS